MYKEGRGTAMIIKVTEKHIYLGQRESADSCPVALAVTEAIKTEVSIDTDSISLDSWKTSTTLPRSAKRFIRNFDNSKPVKPFNFILKQVK